MGKLRLSSQNQCSDYVKIFLKQKVKPQNQPEYIEVKDSNEENKYGNSKIHFNNNQNKCNNNRKLSHSKGHNFSKIQQSKNTDEKNTKKIQKKIEEKLVNEEKQSEKSQKEFVIQENIKLQKASKKQGIKQNLQNWDRKNLRLSYNREVDIKSFLIGREIKRKIIK